MNVLYPVGNRCHFLCMFKISQRSTLFMTISNDHKTNLECVYNEFDVFITNSNILNLLSTRPAICYSVTAPLVLQMSDSLSNSWCSLLHRITCTYVCIHVFMNTSQSILIHIRILIKLCLFMFAFVFVIVPNICIFIQILSCCICPRSATYHN